MNMSIEDELIARQSFGSKRRSRNEVYDQDLSMYRLPLVERQPSSLPNTASTSYLDKLPFEILEQVFHLSLELNLIHTCRYFRAALPHFPTLARKLGFAAFCLFPDPQDLDTGLEDALDLFGLGTPRSEEPEFKARGHFKGLLQTQPPACQIELQRRVLNTGWFTLHWFNQALRDSMNHRLHTEFVNKVESFTPDLRSECDPRRHPPLLVDNVFPLQLSGKREDGVCLLVIVGRFSCRIKPKEQSCRRFPRVYPETHWPYITVNHIPERPLRRPPSTARNVELLQMLRRAAACGAQKGGIGDSTTSRGSTI